MSALAGMFPILEDHDSYMSSLIKLVALLSMFTSPQIIFDLPGSMNILQGLCADIQGEQEILKTKASQQLQGFTSICRAYDMTLTFLDTTPILTDTINLVATIVAPFHSTPPQDYSVSDAARDSCNTGPVRGLSMQLIDELQCIHPGALSPIDEIPNVEVESVVFPYLQTPAVKALKRVAKRSPKKPLKVSSALRTLPQQFMLYRWYRGRRCGIKLASPPGRSHHEHGLALDVLNPYNWRRNFKRKGYRWAGRRDPVHFAFSRRLRKDEGAEQEGPVELRELSIQAFQRLWNRNNPDDRIEVDGDFNRATSRRLAKAPARGFPVGAICDAGFYRRENPVWLTTLASIVAAKPDGKSLN